MIKLKKWMGRASALAAMTALGALSLSGIAAADDVSNSLDPSVDAVVKVMPLNAGGVVGTTILAITPKNGDGKAGCNLTAATVLTVHVASSDPSVATVSPSSITFTSCGDTPSVTVTPVAVGSTTISLSQTANTSGGTFNLAPATFLVNVSAPAPANTAPSVVVSGVTEGASYDVGSVPAATCLVTDAEDGNSSFPATLSPVTGPDAVDGIGSQSVSCSYKDKGDLTAQSSVTYSVVDPTAPTISYVLSPTTPDGDHGWYKGTVALTWTVTEGESPNSLSTDGCEQIIVSADQLSTDYTCSASSAGGTATPVTASIQRDGNGPDVTYDGFVSGTDGANGWYTSDVTVRFTATDGFSGVVPAFQNVSTTGEGGAVTVDSPDFTDQAGNTTSSGVATSGEFKIDKTAPHDVTFFGGPSANGSYYFGDVPTPLGCDATDDVSGMDTCVVTGGGNGVGAHTYTATATDKAGNTQAATLSYTVLAWGMKGFYQPVDMSSPTSTVWNTVKGGSTVPLKFEIFAGSTEKTDTSAVKSFTQRTVTCPNTSATVDEIELTTTGGTSLRYDATGGQFVQNWATPKKPGTCYVTTMTAQDGSTISANFLLK